MVKHTVLVQITGATPFRAEIEVDADDLNPNTPPPHLTGTFIRFDGYETICKALVHTNRFDGGSSHTMYVLDGRHGYRFTMAAPGSDHSSPWRCESGDWTGGFKGRR
jgi:hypothetical protein